MAGFDITENPTFDLRGLGAATSYSPTGRSWDCSVGGLPFLFATSQQYPLHRQTADWRRSRYDSGTDYGEQSLDTGYWVRNQLSFHYGAGQQYAETLESNPDVSRFRFNTGGSIDPWTPGLAQPSFIWASPYSVTTGSAPLATADDSGGLLIANGSALIRNNVGVTWGGSGTIVSLAQDGTNYYAADSTGIYKGTVAGGAGSLLWNTGNANVTVKFVKSRLVAGIGPAVYELVGTGPSLPTALYTHPNSAWKWTSITEGPDCIYLAGYAGATSAIYRLTVTTSGSTITLSAPTVVAELPRNELVNVLYSYLGTYLGVGTSKGLRLAVINQGGSITLSGIQFAPTGGVLDMVGLDSYLYVTGGSDTPLGDGTTAPGVYRVNLGSETADKVWAFAPETAFASVTGTVAAITALSSGKLAAVVASATSGVWVQQASRNGNAWIVLPVIRMGTFESKVFRDVQIRGSAPTGSRIELYASTTGQGAPSSWTLVGALGDGSDGYLSLAAAANGPQETLYLAFKLVSSGATPMLYGYRLRAMPTVHRTRILEVPLLCQDTETDRLGVKMGKQGGSWTRLQALEALEDSGVVVLWQDFTSGEARQATIEKTTFIRTVPPERGYKNAGGIVSLTLRLL